MVRGLNSAVGPSSITSSGESDSYSSVTVITGPGTIFGVAHVCRCLGLLKHVLLDAMK